MTCTVSLRPRHPPNPDLENYPSPISISSPVMLFASRRTLAFSYVIPPHPLLIFQSLFCFGSDISIRFQNLIIFLLISEFSGLSVAGAGKHNRSATKAPQLRKSHSDPRSPKRRRPRLHPVPLFLKVRRRPAVSALLNLHVFYTFF